MGAIFEAKAYVRHLFKAKGRHGVHSPYVYDLITKVLPAGNDDPAWSKIEMLRQEFLRSDQKIHVQDFGSGSRLTKDPSRSVSSIARYVVAAPSHAKAMARIARQTKPKRILELGTSLGFTSAYLGNAAPESQLWTLEGAPAIAGLARQNLKQLGVTNATVVEGAFADTLPEVLKAAGKLDLVLMDGHHLYAPTINYFKLLAPCIAANGLVILDDIHWSAEMEHAWNELSEEPSAGLSLDFYHFGILVFRTDVEKQHFILRLP